MDADAEMPSGDFRLLFARLLRESFPAKDAGEIERYTDRAMERVRRAWNAAALSSWNEVPSLRLFVAALRQNPIRDRLEVRTHTAAGAGAVCGCLGVRLAFIRLATEQVEDLIRALQQSPVSAAARRALSETEFLLADLRTMDELDHQHGSSMMSDLDRLRFKANEISRILPPGPGEKIARALADELNEVERLLNDVRGVDLAAVDLDGLRLEGIRWSRQTRWPSGQAARIRQASEPTGPDEFVILSDDPSAQD